MNDTQLIEQFESGELQSFRHRDHIQVAWLYLSQSGWNQGYQQIQNGIQNFARVHNALSKYHETITRFWALMIHQAIEANPDCIDFEEFASAYPQLLDKTLIRDYYSSTLLANQDARQTWHAPDLKPLVLE